jgi:hypothetical protein
MPLETPLEALFRMKVEIQKEIDRNVVELDTIDARIALYQTAKLHRPAEIPETWEPVLDAAGVVKGWMEPTYAQRGLLR